MRTLVLVGHEEGLVRLAGNGAAALIDRVPVNALAVRPDEPALLYAGTDAGVFSSASGGAAWRAALDEPVPVVAMDLDDPAEAYAGTASGRLYRTRDAGATWQLAATLGGTVRAISTHPAEPQALYAAVDGVGVRRSPDRARRWDAGAGGNLAPAFALAHDPRRPGVVFAAAPDGLYRTVDGGRGWDIVLAAPVVAFALSARGEPVAAVRDGSESAIERLCGGLWVRRRAPGAVVGLAAHPDLPARAYCATAAGAVYGTGDGGSTWRRVAAGLPRPRHLSILDVAGA